MHLMKTSFVFSLCILHAVAEEVCIGETFNTSCSVGEVVVIESAQFGRMHSSRCINLTEKEASCSNDVRQELQKHSETKRNIALKLVADMFKESSAMCDKEKEPFLEFSYHCAKEISNEVCIHETFHASCPTGTVILIQSALYGRMRRSRCLEYQNNDLNCYANVQSHLESWCNRRSECRIKPTNDTLKQAERSCANHLKPYLEVAYTCVPAFSCPPFSPPEGATLQSTTNGYYVTCGNMSATLRLICKYGKWNTDPKKICLAADQDVGKLMIIITCTAIAFIILTSVVVFINTSRRRNPQRGTSDSNEEERPSVRPKPNSRNFPATTPLYEPIDRLKLDSAIYAELLPENSLRDQPNHGATTNVPVTAPQCQSVYSEIDQHRRLPPDSNVYIELLPAD